MFKEDNIKEEKPEFPGSRSRFVHNLQFLQPDLIEGIPVYRVMNRKGEIIQDDQDPQVSHKLTSSLKKAIAICRLEVMGIFKRFLQISFEKSFVKGIC